ncbi:MAG: hypothetical protein LUF29_03020 [Oscillospiraceae bacterium]|nr:hypothetical protein [Oscillospiraceae bacterium]
MSNYKPLPPDNRQNHPRTFPICSFEKAKEIIESSCGNVYIAERHGKGENKVIILPEAFRELEVMVSYGRRSPMNSKEQKFLGFGHFMVDENGNHITVVSHFIQVHTMNRTATSASSLGPNGEYNPGIDFLEYYREEFLANEEKYNIDAFGYLVDPFLEKYGPSEYVFEGHTHPGIGVFYSGTDRASGTARAATSPICIFVCDPIRRQMLGSIGKDFAEAEVIVYSRRDGSNSDATADNDSVSSPEFLTDEDEIVRLTNQCLRTPGYAGNIRTRSRMFGKKYLKIKLAIPKKQWE